MEDLIITTPKKLKSLIESTIINVLTTQASQPPETEPERFMTLTELCDYLPNKPVKATIYRKARKRLIPYSKLGKNLVFLKSEIDAWLRSGKVL